jgi:hypothetical protein
LLMLEVGTGICLGGLMSAAVDGTKAGLAAVVPRYSCPISEIGSVMR